jgi:branched-chain amino acid transport system ATP-binding protein
MTKQPLLEIRQLTKAFGGVVAVRGVDLVVNKGEVIGLIGPNGAGKTTLFGVISGFHIPNSGDIKFDESSIVGLRPDQICKRGLVRTFQIVKPFAELSVIDNVMVGALNRDMRGSEARSFAIAVIEFLGLSKVCNKSAASLPLAYRKRVEIARALATRPKLLLLDEVLSGQNPSEVIDSLRMIRKIKDKVITIIMIEHVMSAIMEISDRIVVLNYGEKIAEGTPREITRNEKVLEAYLGNDFTLE